MSHTTGFGHAYGQQLRVHHKTIEQMVVGLRTAGLAVVLGLAVVTVLQVAYPRSRATPLLKVQGVAVGSQGRDTIAKRLSGLERQQFSLRGAVKTYQPTFQEVGIGVDEQATASRALNYTWRERLVPFSLLRREAVQSVTPQHDNKRLQAWADRLVAENNKPAISASAQKKAQDYVVAPAVMGAKYDSTQVVSELQAIKVAPQTTAVITGQTVPPTITTQAVQQVVEALKQQISKPLQLTVEGAPLTISTTDLAALTSIVTDPATGKVEIQYDQAGFKTKLVAAANAGGAKTGTPVTLDDGVSQVVGLLTKGQVTTSISFQPLTVTTPVMRQYSPTNNGMLALIQDWQRDTGLDTGVFFKELGPPHRQAEYRSHEPFTSASTYKAYIAYYLYTGMDNGTISFDQTIGDLDRPVRACFEEMLVRSTNYCATGFGRAIGWQNLNTFARNAGFTETWIEPNNMSTTAANLASLLERLNAGTLIGPASTQNFLGILQRQMWRDGIPAGVPGIKVSDKVGFLGDSWHDAAIVYDPKGTYILVVMTRGGSTYNIKDLSRRVHQFVNQ